MSIAEILTKAKELISVPERWTQSTYARDQYGCHINATNPAATCWCSLGAIRRAARDARLHQMFEDEHAAKHYLECALGNRYIAAFNDAPERTHAEVMAMFDRAIELAKQGQPA